MVNSMLTSPDGLDGKDKRVCQRVGLNKQVRLKLADGQLINGITEDVSLGGVRISIDDAFGYNIEKTEQMAVLQIRFTDGQLSPEYPCTIVRCDTDSVCLQLDKKKAASFGMMMTRGALKQKKSNH